MWPVKCHITVVNIIGVFLRWLSQRAKELCYNLGYACLSLLPYRAFTHVQRCLSAARRKLSSVAGLFVAPNCMGPLAAPGKETTSYWLQTLELSEDGETCPRNLGCLFLRDTSLTVSQQQFKPGAVLAAKLLFTATAKKKLRLHDSTEGCPRAVTNPVPSESELQLLHRQLCCAMLSSALLLGKMPCLLKVLELLKLRLSVLLGEEFLPYPPFQPFVQRRNGCVHTWHLLLWAQRQIGVTEFR